MKQSGFQKFESECHMAYVFVQNEMTLGDLYNFSVNFSSFVAAKIKEIDDAQKAKEESEKVTESAVEECACLTQIE